MTPDVRHELKVMVLDADLDWIDAMMRVSGATTINSLLLSALYRYSQHLECGVPTTAFELGSWRGKKDRTRAERT